MPEQTSLTKQAGGSPDGSENGEVRGLPGDDQPEDRPSREALLEAVNNRRRRYALHYLQTYGGREPVDLADVSRQVAAWERGVGVDVISYEERKNVHTSLYQFHAPKLDEIGLIDYQKRRSTVRLTEHGENLTLVIDVDDERFGVPSYVPVLSGLSVTTVVGAWLGVPVISAVPNIAWAALVASAFVLTSVLLVRERNGEQVVTRHPPEPTDES
jgi:hypothetical protein